jgi:hypothetical protein
MISLLAALLMISLLIIMQKSRDFVDIKEFTWRGYYRLPEGVRYDDPEDSRTGAAWDAD